MERNKTEYRLAPQALEDMESVWLYSLTQWGLEQTEQYIDRLKNTFLLLTENPKAGIFCEHIRKGYLRYFVNRHVIYYRETEHGIEIIRVLHDRMLASQHCL